MEYQTVLHVYRVMFYTLIIGYDIGDIKTTRNAFFSAFLHDLNREHDYMCDMHGAYSIEKQLPKYINIIKRNGATNDDIEAIKLAVTNHCQNFEIEKDNIYYKVVSLLRDSDGLDLVRINVTPSSKYLRNKESIKYIDFAQKLYDNTFNKKFNTFTEFLDYIIDNIL